MDVKQLRGYGMAFSDGEALWPDALKAEMRRKGQAVVMSRLSLFQQLQFGIFFLLARRQAAGLDLSDLRANGLKNEKFVTQQLEYLALFAALARVLDGPRAVKIMDDVMVETAPEALLLCLPDAKDMAAFPDPLAAWKAFSRPAPAASCAANCNRMEIVEDTDDAFQFDITWCVWLELAQRMGLPEACLPNCTADELVFPKYFDALGIAYKRSGTLAEGKKKCDFRFERKKTKEESS